MLILFLLVSKKNTGQLSGLVYLLNQNEMYRSAKNAYILVLAYPSKLKPNMGSHFLSQLNTEEKY